MKHSIEAQRSWQADLKVNKPMAITLYYQMQKFKAEPKIIMHPFMGCGSTPSLGLNCCN